MQLMPKSILQEALLRPISPARMMHFWRYATLRAPIMSTRPSFWRPTLSYYDIPSYVDYFCLKPLIKDLVAPQSDILDSLKRYDGSAIADRLRNDCLLELGKARDWATFDQQHPKFVLEDDTQLKCYALTPGGIARHKVAAYACTLLTIPKDFGQAYTCLIGRLAQNRQFTADDVWFEIRQVVEFGFGAIARRMTSFVDVGDAQVTQAIDESALKLGPSS